MISRPIYLVSKHMQQMNTKQIGLPSSKRIYMTDQAEESIEKLSRDNRLATKS